ncbi:MAG: DUF3833 family protein [Caulobacteraceae bacterium]
MADGGLKGASRWGDSMPQAAGGLFAASRAATNVFRPDVFFLGRTEGAGILRDPSGRDRCRFTVATTGHSRPGRPEIEIRATFTFEDGEADAWRWVMRDSGAGNYLVAEARAGAGIIGTYRGGDYVLRFRRPLGPARGMIAPRFVSRLTSLGPAVALKTVSIDILGVPLGNLTAVLHRLDPSPEQ